MSKIYTAQAMREMASREMFKCSFVTRTLNGGIILDCTSDVCAMLRQAADALEKYEYRIVTTTSATEYGFATLKSAKEFKQQYKLDEPIFRRTVGEWEEVKE